jgi:hypothetical protein
VHFTPLSTETGHGVIVMFQVDRNNKTAAKKVKAKNTTNSAGPKKAAKKKPR